MNLVDLAVIIILGLAAAHGVTQGAAMQVFSFGGFWLGLFIGAALAPVFSGLSKSNFVSAFISLVTFLGLALVGGALGRYFGTRAWHALRKVKLGHFDSALGAVVAVVAALFVVWLLAILLIGVGPSRTLSRAVNRSVIVRALVQHLPAEPKVLSRLQKFVQATPFPRVFEGIEPIPKGPIGVPGNATVQAAVRAAGASTVRIYGVGCGGIQTGSGFVAAAGYVVTNAHVVAGISSPEVQDANGSHAATPVLFDPELDVAVLRTQGRLAGRVLPLLATDVPSRTGGAVLGYPGGGKFQASSAAVIREFVAIGRDIYGRNLTKRNVYQLQASIHQGNSGGPFVRQDGEVLGVVFAASTTESNVGYALTSPQIAQKVRDARSSGRASTGNCTD